MDTIEQIRKQVGLIAEAEQSIYLDAVRLHLERAEYYYLQGDNDSYFFNDVIYRTNQAFEGALKEAYKVLANKTEVEVDRETPFKIEKFFEDNSIFKERVLELFRNYRSEWRNKSTHDYKLFFDESEAFIALTSVSSFVFLLLKQIMEKLAFNKEQENIKKSKLRKEKIAFLLKTKPKSLELITSLLSEFITTHKLNNGTDKYETEIIGMLNAYLSAFENIKFQVQPNISKGLRPDYILEVENEKSIIEVKRYLTVINIEPAINQLLTYLKHSNIEQGILLAISTKTDNKGIKIVDKVLKLDETTYSIKIIQN
ncbi:MAG: hypothetical protein HOO91_00615 [Bacteroidales bacterium]|nr:hypothetical protein [Bacteroidales bacterium]